ncbi:ROK family transcriptional regulator [Actinospica sp.]|jgi:predicted NBD/HSP70 family sugar kinase|uniref:ROK family transcriptional regulator n=1 Tax=Actinospica sp. TaxID=1872142 RepID=UPI002CA2697C|nr:ROK family transcriptional regulator [Actinospica sp.]HWG22966.1 ROK family transcriptional regulator [Actinospica sp.]
MRQQSGTNLPKVGSYNQNVVLDAIRSSGATSRVELAERTGLTAQTISVIVRRLLTDGLVREDGARPSVGPSGGGKPRTTLRVEPTAGYAVGLHFDPGQIAAVLVDLAGSVLAETRREVHHSVQPEEAVELMGKAVRKVVREAGIPRRRMLGVGLACPGPIDQNLGLVLYPPRLAGWERVPLGTLLEESTGSPVTIDNDATAAAIGERWSGVARNVGNFVYLYMGTGIGGGLFLGNQVYRGPYRNAAELGHIAVAPDGPQCYCGNRGCLEAVACPDAMVADAHKLLADGGGGTLAAAYARDPASVDHDALCAAAAAGDPLARTVVDRVAGYLSDVAVSVANMLDVELFVLGGPALGPVGGIYREAIDEALSARPIARRVHKAPVSLSPAGSGAGAIGAASLVFHRAFAPQLTTLLNP